MDRSRRRFLQLASVALTRSVNQGKLPTVALRLVSNDGMGTIVISTEGTHSHPSTVLANWQLFWGDGKTESGLGAPPPTLPHTYIAEGTYQITLVVTDGKGLMAGGNLSVGIYFNPPTPLPPDVTYGTRFSSSSIVRGPQPSITCPVGSIAIAAGASIQTAINNNPAGTTFCLGAGIHSITASLIPKTGNTFIGQSGAIIDGSGWVTSDNSQAAFRSHLQGTINNVTIRNLVIRNMPQRAVHAWWQSSSGWIVEYCEIYNCFCGVSFPGNSIIRNNYIHNCTGNSQGGVIPNGGYISTTGAGSTFEQNEVSFCGETQKVIDHADNVTFRKNWFHHNTGVAIWYDGDCINGLVEDNTLEDNGFQGVMYEISAFGTIRYNTIRRNGDDAIFISNARDNVIHNNLLVDNFRAIILLVNLTNVWPPDQPYAGALGWDLRNNNVHDNSVTLTLANLPPFPISNGTTSVNAGDLTPYTSNTKQNNFDYDRYFGADGFLYYWGNYKTFAQWQALGYDTHGTLT